LASASKLSIMSRSTMAGHDDVVEPVERAMRAERIDVETDYRMP
jgi:hypothetical protein